MPSIMRKRAEGAGQAPRAVITTESVDRDGDIIRADGIDTSKFMKNPVVLFGHSHRELPVGKATSVQRTGQGLVAEWEWATHRRAQEVREAWEGGFLRGVSVGFIPKKTSPRPGGRGVIFEKSELLEFSVTPVPANADALAASLGGKGDRLAAELASVVARETARVLAPFADAAGCVDVGEDELGAVVTSATASALAPALAALDEGGEDVTEIYDDSTGEVLSLVE